MKKFLCYDTNDAASGKISVDSRGMLKPNSTVPSGSTPYQQLVTDGTGTAKWEDRLAYTAIGYGEIVPEQTYSFSPSGPFYAASFEGVTLMDGETYSVKFDGQLYDCVWQYNERLQQNVFGNFSWMGLEDTGEPFFGMSGNNGELVIGTTDTSSEHTLSISGKAETINKIPEKYLPVASSGHYGVVDRDSIVVPYEFAESVEKNVMENALKEVQLAKAMVRWGTRIIREAAFLVNGGIVVRFDDDPNNQYEYKPKNGTYNISKYESIRYPKTFTLQSSTSGSSKKFKITVDDSGAITATAVTS